MYRIKGGFAASFIALFALAMISAPRADCQNIYLETGLNSFDYIPFEDDGTPNRPKGDHLGNTITFGGTARLLNHVQAVFGSFGPKQLNTYTLSLYRNDGAPDPNGSGLLQPGTQIATFQTIASNQPLPGNGGYGVDWFFAPIFVPDTLTVVLSSDYSTTTPNQFMGPFASVVSPLVGSAVNTAWYGDGTPGKWVADSNWAIADGGVTNYFDVRFDAVPEPSAFGFALGAGVPGLFLLRRLRRK